MLQTIVWPEKSEIQETGLFVNKDIFPMQEFLLGHLDLYYYVIKLSCGFLYEREEANYWEN